MGGGAQYWASIGTCDLERGAQLGATCVINDLRGVRQCAATPGQVGRRLGGWGWWEAYVLQRCPPV